MCVSLVGCARRGRGRLAYRKICWPINLAGLLKGKINGIYTKGLLDRENFHKCLSLLFSDQHAF